MNQKKLTIILSVLTIVIAAMALLVAWQNRAPRTVELPLSATERVFVATTTTILNESEWSTYENIKYGYRFKYPIQGLLQKTAEMERGILSESADIDLSIPGVGGLLQVSVDRFYPFDLISEVVDNSSTKLEYFTENVHRYQVESKNPNFENKQTGNLFELVFAGKDSYGFTLDGYFEHPGGGYVIVGTHRYIITEHSGSKFIIHYPIDDKLAQEVIDSFEFMDK